MKNRYKICIVMSQPQTKNSRAPHTKMLSSKTDDITAYKDKTNCSIGSNINERLNTICMWSKILSWNSTQFRCIHIQHIYHDYLQMRETWLFSVCFCKGPEFASHLDTVFQFASRETSLPLSIVGDVNLHIFQWWIRGGAVELIYLYNIENSI